MSWKKFSWIGMVGVLLVVGGLILAFVFGAIFIIHISGIDRSLNTGPAIWGQFGDFLGGTFGILLTAGSALLVIETIRKQVEHEQIRAFEAKFFDLASYNKSISEKIFNPSKSDLCNRIKDVKDELIQFCKENPKENLSKDVLRDSFLKQFGTSILHDPAEVAKYYKGLENKSERYQGLNPLSITDKNGTSYGAIDKPRIEFLGSYFRSLISVFNLLESAKSLSEIQKSDYAYFLTSQQSEDEHFLIALHYSSLSSSWLTEKAGTATDLIEKFNIIRNIPSGFLPNINFKELFPRVEFEWERFK